MAKKTILISGLMGRMIEEGDAARSPPSTRMRRRVERTLKRERALRDDPERDFDDLLARLATLASELKEAEIPELDELVDLFKRCSLQERLEREPEKVRVSELAALFRLELQLEQRRAYRRVKQLSMRGYAAASIRLRRFRRNPAKGMFQLGEGDVSALSALAAFRRERRTRAAGELWGGQ
jgi:hypothetical protein